MEIKKQLKKQRGKKKITRKKTNSKKKSKDSIIEKIESTLSNNPKRAKELAKWLLRDIKKQEMIDEELLIKTYELLIESKMSMIK